AWVSGWTGARRLAAAVEAQRPPLRRLGTCKDGPDGLVLEGDSPQTLQLGWRPRQHDDRRPRILDHEPGRGPGEPERARALGQRGLLADTRRKVRIRAAEPLGVAA